MNYTPENLHTYDEFVQYLGLSVEARETLHLLDNRHTLPLSEIVGRPIDGTNIQRIENHAETVRNIFSRMAGELLQINREFSGPNRSLQTSYQGAIRSMLESPNKVECDRIIRFLWNQFDREKVPTRALGKPIVLGDGG